MKKLAEQRKNTEESERVHGLTVGGGGRKYGVQRVLERRRRAEES